ncbi:MAG: thioredoxin family protein [Alphaproteobacteria bacterium]|nr:thioredoxin family protein [Alphaproteobacteria bacterium]
MFRILLALLALLLPAPSYALSSDWVRGADVSVRLVSGVDGVGNGDTVPLGLEIDLADGWHTYWRSPGEAGIPPQLDWSHSQTPDGNLKTATLLYPAPKRYTAYGLETVGYRGHIVFPIDATLAKPGQALNADAAIDLLICSSICVPKHFDLHLTVPAGAATPGAEADLLQQARAALPTDAEKAGILITGVNNDGKRLSFSITTRDALQTPDIFVEDPDNIGFGAPVIKMNADNHDATLTVTPTDTLPDGTTLAGMPLTVTITNGDHAAEIKLHAPPATPVSAPPAPLGTNFITAVLLALLGGLILNLMPCVLPVLSLKILGIVSHGGGTPRRVRYSFLHTAAGIIVSFIALAAATVALNHFGLALGWGVQFQQPLFLIFLITLLTFFAANLWGLFEIPLPRFLADRVDPAYHPKLAGDFATGALATLLATPCSAPFLGTAVGFALASGTAQIFAIFAALGCGMAAPYLAVAAFPRAATLLPRPGAWMITLRIVLGIALALTAIWLTWVLAAQITVSAATALGLLMTGIVILLALRKQGMKRGLILAGILEFCLVALVLGFTGMDKPKAAPEMDRKWLAYSPDGLAADIAEGKTVFLDVTADWCLTCKANMKFTLTRGDVAQRLFHSSVVAMQADWTNPDPVITGLLRKYNRYGIPFNIVYGPGAPHGIVLPELLDAGDVLDALDKASAAPTSQTTQNQ